MNFTRNWITSAAETLNQCVIELSVAETNTLLSAIRQQFCNKSIGGRAIWDDLRDDYGVRWEEGWRMVGAYVGEQPCILIVEDEPCAFRISNGVELNKLLGECPGFEFYVTDDAHRYLLCHNDHDYLIGAGDAARWVKWTYRKTFLPHWEWDEKE